MSHWLLAKRFTFEASHQLPAHDGKCARLHGHSWVGWVEVKGEALQLDGPKAGMVLDYGDLSAAIRPLVEAFLDHHHLNATTGLANPTSEALAEWLADALAGVLPGLTRVVIEETCTSRCEFVL